MVMKREKTGNLYKLLGETFISGVDVATKVEPSCDNTELWHMRLDQLREHKLNKLHKGNLLQGVKPCKLDFCKFCVMEK